HRTHHHGSRRPGPRGHRRTRCAVRARLARGRHPRLLLRAPPRARRPRRPTARRLPEGSRKSRRRHQSPARTVRPHVLEAILACPRELPSVPEHRVARHRRRGQHRRPSRPRTVRSACLTEDQRVFTSGRTHNTQLANASSTRAPAPTATGVPATSATVPASNDPIGPIPTNTNAYAAITRPRRWSGDNVCKRPFASALFWIIANPTSASIGTDTHNVRVNEKRNRKTQNDTDAYANH